MASGTVEAFDALRRLRLLATWLEDVCVDTARANGWSWQQIGRSLGRTKQGAQQRHAARPPAREAPRLTNDEVQRERARRVALHLRRERLRRQAAGLADTDPEA